MEIQKLDRHLKALVNSERKICFEILLVIQTLDLTKSYRKLSYSSLFKYLTEEIEYSEGAAQRRISSARLLKSLPEFENDVKTGALNLSQLTLAQSAFTQMKASKEKKVEVLSKMRKQSLFNSKRILIEEFPNFKMSKPPQPRQNNMVEVTLQFTKEEFEEIQSLMAEISHSIPDQKLESALLHWARSGKKAAPKKSPPLRRKKRKPVSRTVHKYNLKKAEGRCEYVSPINGKRCDCRHFIEDEHIIPVAHGGTNEPTNLRIFCRQHNQLAAKELGFGLAQLQRRPDLMRSARRLEPASAILNLFESRISEKPEEKSW